jgi:hypothetical protein
MHFKLFEEFSNFIESKYYTQTKELPGYAKFSSKDDEQIEAVQLALFNMGYQWPGGEKLVNKETLQWNEHVGVFYWYVLRTSNKKKITLFPPGLKIPPVELEFDDYFEPKSKYMGHSAGKKYGI